MPVKNGCADFVSYSNIKVNAKKTKSITFKMFCILDNAQNAG
jgi:hypothetical protein